MRFPKQFIADGSLASMDLPGGAWRVLLVLIAEAGEDSIASITQKEIATLAGISRISVQTNITRLESKGVVKASTGRGKKHEYDVLPTYKLQSTPVIRFATYPQAVANPEVGNFDDKLQSPGYATPKSGLTRVLNSPTGTNHPNEPNTLRALNTLITDRKLPIPLQELLHRAYRIGNGDPWDGYRTIKQITEKALEPDVRNPAAVIRHRLEEATPTQRMHTA